MLHMNVVAWGKDLLIFVGFAYATVLHRELLSRGFCAQKGLDL